jgi:glucuronokinase
MIRTTAFPRAALIGNPSDGYFGKTIAFVFSNFEVQVDLHESAQLEIIPGKRDRMSFSSMNDLVQKVQHTGYYGGVRLLKASIKKFSDYCAENNIPLTDKNFSISFYSSIPDGLGLAGSSAIVTAAMQSMMQFYSVEIPKPLLANLILSAEKDELKIGAGLQDRVAQVYGCPVFMNFDKSLMEKQGFGEYIPFGKSLLPPLFIAYRSNLSEGSEVTHNDLATRFAKGEPQVLQAMQQWASLTEQAFARLNAGDKKIADLLNANFDLRNQLIQVSEGNKQLVMTARALGASAKFTGSGGAIIGTYRDEKMLEDLVKAMKKIDAEVIIPTIV